MTETYEFCTLFETLCVVLWIDVLPIPRVDTDIWNSIGLFPSLAQGFCTLCKVLQHLRVHPVVEVVVILELLNLVQSLFAKGLSISMHLIGFPFPRIFVTVWDQTAVIPILVHMLHAVKQLTCRHPVVQVLQT